jgi:hypothetical protein
MHLVFVVKQLRNEVSEEYQEEAGNGERTVHDDPSKVD